MYRVLDCLTVDHDFTLVLLAVAVCLATAITTFVLYGISHHYQDRRRIAWAALAGVCAGAGIWTTHFIAMLAYKGGLQTLYEPLTTIASLLVAVALASLGFSLARYGRHQLTTVGGFIVGLAIGVMHYLGMGALVIPGYLTWDANLVVASIAFGTTFAVAALFLFQARLPTPAAVIASASLLTLAVCSLHFTAMGAVLIVPDPTVAVLGIGFNRLGMALAVSAVSFVVLLSAIAAASIHRANEHCETILREHNVLLATALGHLPVAVSMFDAENKLMMCNDAYRRLHQLDEATGAAPGQTDAPPSPLAAGEQFVFDTITLSDGRLISKRIIPIKGGGCLDVQEDITAATSASKRLAWLAHHDTLTGIFNRLAFRERLEREFASYDPRTGFALHWIDLDNFKDLNDSLGHQFGDDLLRCVARRLSGSLRATDAIGRLGGDEFAVLQVGVHNPADAAQFAERLLSHLRGPHEIRNQQIAARASIGVAIAPLHGADADELFASADKALYRAKSRGRDGAMLFDATARVTELKNPLVDELQAAIESAEFVLHYQPIVSLRRQRVSCMEALVRWKHPSRGMIPPSDFISIAEETGLIVPLGSWVLNAAMREATKWPSHVAVAVNLSPRQVERADFAASVADAMKASGIDPSRVHLEITETVLLRDQVQAAQCLKQLNALGVSLSLDDFGKSFSNLDYLRQYPFRRLKLDKSFVQGLPQDEECQIIVGIVADLAHKLGIGTVAEGVETLANLHAVQSQNYDEAQGFFFSLPVPASAVRRTIENCEKRLSRSGMAA